MSRDAQLLSEAIALAAEVHRRQLDKAGEPYILHAIRVMMAVEGLEAKTVAVLHDVLEDGDGVHLGWLPIELVDEVECLTRRQHETYPDYIQRIRNNGGIARQVKLADLADNLVRSRIPHPTAADEARWKKYEAAREMLESPAPQTQEET